ncbi:hypothetical protein BC831DRAFT_47688 [Entophlyctis helioformis]|nr:hypothetical protein BC831DRAFT_47688 [Entophlyctis helioformis]
MNPQTSDRDHERDLVGHLSIFLRNVGVEADESLTAAFASRPQLVVQELRRFSRAAAPLIASLAVVADTSVETSPAIMDDAMSQFLHKHRKGIDESNIDEFTTIGTKRAGSARVDATALDRKRQMRLNVVHNTSGPLERSTFGHSASDDPTVSGQALSMPGSGLYERVRHLEHHLGIPTSTAGDLYQRVKQLEDRIVQIEDDMPTFAAFEFSQPETYAKQPSKELTERLFSMMPPRSGGIAPKVLLQRQTPSTSAPGP